MRGPQETFMGRSCGKLCHMRKTELCEYETCQKEMAVGRLCRGHYAQQWRGEDLRPLRGNSERKKSHLQCDVIGCERPQHARGVCDGHYQQLRRGAEISPLASRDGSTNASKCLFPGCPDPAHSRGLCGGHYDQHNSGRELSEKRISRKTDPRYAETECAVTECARLALLNGKLCTYCRRRADRYTLSPEALIEMLRPQRCEGCGTVGKRLCVDHDHRCCRFGSCGKCVRGVLCHSCNTTLGHAERGVCAMPKQLEVYLSRCSSSTPDSGRTRER